MDSGFKDPLEDVDPVMEQAFSYDDQVSEDEEEEDLQSLSYQSDHFDDDSNQQVDREGTQDKIVDEKNSLPKEKVMGVKFSALSDAQGGTGVEFDKLGNIPIEVSVELGRSKMSLSDLFSLREGTIINAERFVGEPIDLVVDSQVIAKGEVVSVNNHYGLRITSIVAEYKSS